MKFHDKFLSCAQCVIFLLLVAETTAAVGSFGDGKFAECIHEEMSQGTSPEDALDICEVQRDFQVASSESDGANSVVKTRIYESGFRKSAFLHANEIDILTKLMQNNQSFHYDMEASKRLS